MSDKLRYRHLVAIMWCDGIFCSSEGLKSTFWMIFWLKFKQNWILISPLKSFNLSLHRIRQIIQFKEKSWSKFCSHAIKHCDWCSMSPQIYDLLRWKLSIPVDFLINCFRLGKRSTKCNKFERHGVEAAASTFLREIATWTSETKFWGRATGVITLLEQLPRDSSKLMNMLIGFDRDENFPYFANLNQLSLPIVLSRASKMQISKLDMQIIEIARKMLFNLWSEL